MNTTKKSSRAVVLGGGGVTGIAWEIGVIAGLKEGGIDLADADALFGTSAGAYAAAIVASGEDIEARYRAQFVPDTTEIPVVMPPEVREQYAAAVTANYGQAVPLAKAYGEIARNAQTVTTEARLTTVRARLGIEEWPSDRLHFTSIDAETGELVVLDNSSGLTLVEAANATGAVPGVWPMAHAAGRTWIDGGMISATNPQLARGYDRVVIIAPAPASMSGFDDVETVAAALRAEGAQVIVIVPDDATQQAIGPNPFDPSRRGPSAEGGRRQGLLAAEHERPVWG